MRNKSITQKSKIQLQIISGVQNLKKIIIFEYNIYNSSIKLLIKRREY